MATRKTKNPRIAFVPSDLALELIQHLAETSGLSMASIVSQLIDDIAPVMKDQLAAFQAIADRPDKVREHVEQLAEQQRNKIDQTVLEFNEDQRTVEAKKAKRRRSSGPT